MILTIVSCITLTFDEIISTESRGDF